MREIQSVKGGPELVERIQSAESVRDWSFILSDHIATGNNKIHKKTAIFNLNSAHDCPNRETHEDDSGEGGVGQCQVLFDECYAQAAEKQYPAVKPYRRRQEYLWSVMSPDLWASAFECLNARKRNPFDSIRFSEAGDFRTNEDISQVNTIARCVDIAVYTYSASFKLDWSLATDFTVNDSTGRNPYANRQFTALPKGSDLPEGMVWCANDLDESSEPIKCGECRLCINPEGPDVAIELH